MLKELVEGEVKFDGNEYSQGGGNMRKSIAALALVAFVALGLLYTGAMTLAHGYVHVSKTVKTKHGIYHKSVTHTKHGTVIRRGAMAY
jgi:hypothetical protein